MGTVTLLEEEGKVVCVHICPKKENENENDVSTGISSNSSSSPGSHSQELADESKVITNEDWLTENGEHREKMKRGMTLPEREEEGSFYLSCHCTHVSEFRLCVLSDNRKKQQHWAELSTLWIVHTPLDDTLSSNSNLFQFLSFFSSYCHCRLFCLPTCFISFRRHCQQQQQQQQWQRQTEQQKNY